MKILYLHGFGSKVQGSNPKYRALAKLGEVIPHAPTYESGDLDTEVDKVIDLVIKLDIDLVVGTSFGGWMASQVGPQTGTPFVALNPVIDPEATLNRQNIPFEGVFEPFGLAGCGLVMVNDGDELLDPAKTVEYAQDNYKVYTFSGGNHQFTNIREVIPLISDFYEEAQLVYGSEDLD